jgi:hypothetical protein
MHAPKVALADEGGSTTLVADLGHFTLTTDSQQADSLTEDERAVYDCFQLRWAQQAGQQVQQVQQRWVNAGLTAPVAGASCLVCRCNVV